MITAYTGLFAQGFIASYPENRILWLAFTTMMEFYQSNGVARNDDALMGPKTFLEAFQRASPSEKAVSYLLSEINLESLNHTKFKSKLRSGGGGSCNYVICDPPPQMKNIYFYTRFVGASRWCSKL